MKRAAIYIRASTKIQDERDSPKQQLYLCELLAEKKGYEVVAVYKDIESGEKRRPEFFRMLAGGEAGLFGIVLADMQDRLYRGEIESGYREFANLVHKKVFEVELASENFDADTMGLMAWVAGRENRTRVKRINRGIKAMLREGKPWMIQNKFGYSIDKNGAAVVDIKEMQAVKQIYKWRVSGVGVREICRRLMSKGITTKQGGRAWHTGSLYRILNYSTYHTGIHKITRDGETFDIPVPKIIDEKQYRQHRAISEKNKHHPARNIKHRYLLSGLITSPCGVGWNAFTRIRQKPYEYKPGTYTNTASAYQCNRSADPGGAKHDLNCPISKGVVRLDRHVWERVSKVLKNPKLLQQAAFARIKELEDQHKGAAKRRRELEKELDKIGAKRERYTHLYGETLETGGRYTKDDLDRDLGRLEDKEHEIRLELAEIELVTKTPTADLEKLVNMRLEDIKRGAAYLDKEPEGEIEAEEQYQERKTTIQALVANVELTKDQDPKIILAIDESELLQVKSHSYSLEQA